MTADRPRSERDRDDLESRLRTTMLRHEHEAPDAQDLRLDVAHPAPTAIRTGRSRRALRYAVPALAAAAVVAAVVVSTSLTHERHPGDNAGAPPSGSNTASANSSHVVPTPPPVQAKPPVTIGSGPTKLVVPGTVDYVPVQFRGLQLFYPSMGGGACADLHGTFATGPIPDNSYLKDCRSADDPRYPQLVFAATDTTPTIDVSAATEPTTVDGRPALTGSRDGYDYIVVPSLKVAVRFSAGRAEWTEQTRKTASIVTADPYGCPLRIDSATTPAPQVPGAGAQLVPGRPVSALDCNYVGSDVVTPSVRTTIVLKPATARQALNALTRSSSSCSARTDRDRHLLFTYADGTVLDVRARTGSCDDVTFTNGATTRIGDDGTVPISV